MALLNVGIGECKVSKDMSDILVTHALGSCIAVLMYDPAVKVAGLLHYMLPEAGLDSEKAGRSPFLFADTGISLLLHNICEIGAAKSRLVVMAAGGAQMLDPSGTFNIGHRNYQAMRKILWKAGVIVHKEEIGGTSSRTVRIEVASGRVQLRTSGGPEQDMVVNSRKIGAGDGVQHTHRR